MGVNAIDVALSTQRSKLTRNYPPLFARQALMYRYAGLMQLFRKPGCRCYAENLGVVPVRVLLNGKVGDKLFQSAPIEAVDNMKYVQVNSQIYGMIAAIIAASPRSLTGVS